MNELDLNLSRCLIEKQSLTETIVTNVCTGEVYNVPHQAVDYLIGGILCIVLFACIGMVIALGVLIFRD